jgi:pimeloyl-ACP methyl ester carboxylesterase
VSARTAASFFTYRPATDWGEVGIPTLVLVGEGDEMVTADYAREVVDRSWPPDSELRVLPGLGHLLFHEHLPATVEQMVGFLREHAAAPAPA